MKSLKFPFANVILKNQDTKEPELFIHETEDGHAIIALQLTDEEIEKIKEAGNVVFISLVTFGNRMQPIYPDFGTPYDNDFSKCNKCGNLELTDKLTLDADNDEQICRDCMDVITGGDDKLKVVN